MREPLSADDQEFWDGAEAAFPHWGFFQRLELSAEDLQANEQDQEMIDDWWAAMIDEADEITIEPGEFGLEKYLLRFHLKDEDSAPAAQTAPWWKRLFRSS